MAGGLIQLAVYGTQDIFLTGTPQITFFKIVYRRYTNFAIESISQELLGLSNFGTEVACVIDKIGDLMHKTYLEIIIPKVDLIKNPANWTLSIETATTQFQQIQDFYQLVYTYISSDTDIARKLQLLCETVNIPTSDIIVTMNDPTFIGTLVENKKKLQLFIATSPIFDSIVELRDQKLDLIQEVNRIDIQVLFNSVVTHVTNFGVNVPDEQKNAEIRSGTLYIINNSLYPAMKDFYMKAYTLYVEKKTIYQSFIDGTYVERYKFAWVEEIGHAIIDQIDIKIGNQVIDRHTGDWMIVFNKIFNNEYQKINYDKMIGNIPEIYVFDDEIKNEYKLIIPLQFWFCRHNGIALPLVALRYHDVMLTLKYKELSQLCYVEDNLALLDIPNIQARYGINIVNANLYVDYVYLDSDERRRFAQSTHEYLIEIVQYTEINDILGKQYNANLYFAHPTKFVIWYVQPNQYRYNLTGRNKCQWNNFGTRPDKTGYTLNQTYIRINSYERTDTNHDIKFFNYVQPYLYFRHSPTDGFNLYSFSIRPMELQPSASCNMSRIDNLGIILGFSDEMITLVNSNTENSVQDGIFMGIYIYSYNIIRIMSGMAGLAFQTSS